MIARDLVWAAWLGWSAGVIRAAGRDWHGSEDRPLVMLTGVLLAVAAGGGAALIAVFLGGPGWS